MRIVMIIAVQIISMIGSYYYAVPCDKLAWFFPDPSVLPQVYPSCTPYVQNSNTTSYTVINANFTGNVFEVMASFNMTFGMAAWISFFMHAVGVEIYVSILELVETSKNFAKVDITAQTYSSRSRTSSQR